MIGYLGNPGATAATIDSEGWIHTGDIGYYDEVRPQRDHGDHYSSPQAGSVFIEDRKKELIKVKGLQVAPAELENTIRSMEGVEDVAVIGQ